MVKSEFVESKQDITPHVETAIYKQALDELRSKTE